MSAHVVKEGRQCGGVNTGKLGGRNARSWENRVDKEEFKMCVIRRRTFITKSPVSANKNSTTVSNES